MLFAMANNGVVHVANTNALQRNAHSPARKKTSATAVLTRSCGARRVLITSIAVLSRNCATIPIELLLRDRAAFNVILLLPYPTTVI